MQVVGDVQISQFAGHCWHKPVELVIYPGAHTVQVLEFLQARQLEMHAVHSPFGFK